MTMTPQETRTAAADRLRKAAMTAGRHGTDWAYRERHTYTSGGGSGNVLAGKEPIVHGGSNDGRRPPFVLREHGQWIATVDPALGLLIAAWLENAGDGDECALAVAARVLASTTA